MRLNERWILILVVITFLWLVGWTGSQQKQSAKKTTTWEYKIINGLSEEQLNQFGSQGWELVAVGVGDGQQYNYLKRAK